jgi:hypothetical protein
VTDRLTEAIARSDALEADGGGSGFYVPDVEIFLAAARAYQEGTDIRWCETHHAVKDAPSYPGCRDSMRPQSVHYFKPCVIVSRRVCPPIEGETR